MRVAYFMTRLVITVTPDTPILAAAQLMLKHKISGMPVVDATGRVVGIVSEHDLLRRRGDGEWADGPHWLELMIERVGLADETARFHHRTVSEVMTPSPVTIGAASSLADACRLIEERGIKRLPVVHQGRLVGIIARADLVRAFAKSVEKAGPALPPDVSVGERLAELERQVWRSRARLPKQY